MCSSFENTAVLNTVHPTEHEFSTALSMSSLPHTQCWVNTSLFSYLNFTSFQKPACGETYKSVGKLGESRAHSANLIGRCVSHLRISVRSAHSCAPRRPTAPPTRARSSAHQKRWCWVAGARAVLLRYVMLVRSRRSRCTVLRDASHSPSQEEDEDNRAILARLIAASMTRITGHTKIHSELQHKRAGGGALT